MIVRLYDCENSLTKATLTFAEGMLESVEECNLMEEKEDFPEFFNSPAAA